MTRRVYESYAIDDLRHRKLEHIAGLMNARTSVNEAIAVFRNTYGDIFELRFDDDHVHVWTASGGVSLAKIAITPETTVEDTLVNVENASRVWSRGYVPCAECGALLQRFLTPEQAAQTGDNYVALAYHGGRYCRDCAPKYERLARTEVD